MSIGAGGSFLYFRIMKKSTLLFWAAISCSSLLAQEPQPLVNAIALPNGSFMIKTPPSLTPTNLMGGAVQPFSPEALFDLSPKMWCSKNNSSGPFVFIMELTEVYNLEKMIFNNKCEKNNKGLCTKEIKVEFSTTSALDGYSEVNTFTLPEHEITTFTFPAKEARWIKLTILSNYGNASFTELAEVEVYGSLKNPEIKTIDITGRWESNWGWVQLAQSGSSMSGNYEFNSGKIPMGGIERSRISFKWVEKKINREGWVTLFLNQDGTRLTGVWCYDNNWKEYGFWIYWRKAGVPLEPIVPATASEPVKEEPPAPPVKVNQEIVTSMVKELKDDGKIILYGINFKVNSAEILPASFTVLDQLAEVLKQNPKVKVTIEGHTDNTGTDDYNLKLSASRAEAVKKYLTDKHQIEASRTEAVGKGEAFPVSDNTTETGKATNRRVEIHQK
jgi:outer membrane protein OmpA-like peptidoglycan-associated protein